ncbi:MAG: biotin--[acetyl-CoA-carboxylase] ligase [Polaribacter sp.]|uniref:biotin--[acetyl-CoA-carboxylase] ligase n=1 Tax=Polaribacter sp. TaxID=1920175 RepID=UPI003BB1195A
MKLIKLNAIDSTNSFLKELKHHSTLENFTVVVANDQKNGRGQQNSHWHSEPYKNLTFSVFISDLNIDFNNVKYLNFAISLSVFEVLYKKEIHALSIKWPNDILSANKKVCGILIENSLKGNKINDSIIGIGLNVNQEKFPNSLKDASSLKNITGLEYNLDDLLSEIIDCLKTKIELLKTKKKIELKNAYLEKLYKKNIPAMFKDKENNIFIGIIKGISESGNLLVQTEDDCINEFGVKEISFA